MIPSASVKAYISRELDSHVWLKKLTKKQLWAEVNRLQPKPRLYPKLGAHQLVCFLLGVAYPKFAFWLDMGTGKTLITLSLLQYWWDCNELRRAVIFITSDKAFATWEKQINRYDIDIPYTLLEGSSQDKARALEEFGDGLVFVSYPGAVWLTAAKTKTKKKTKMRLSDQLVAQFARRVDAFVMDESTRASGHTSLTFELMEELGKTAPTRYALAGRPFGRDPTLLWAQHYLLDKGETLGPTLGMFRAAFFTESESRWVPKHKRKYIKQYKFDKRKEPKLARLIQHRSITYSAEECIDLPKYIPIIEEVSFAEEAGEYYNRAVQSMIEAKGNMEVVKNVFLRMRQISSGFLGFKDDDTGERAQVEFEENPKFDRLMELLDSQPLDRKGVVFYEYTHSGNKIYEEAKKLGLNPIWLWSGTKNYKKDMENFEKLPQYRVAVINNKVGAFSLDGLQVANYAYFYESPVSSIDREQAERRLRRQGQTRKVFQYDLIVRGSMDQKILDFHKEGESLMQSLLRNPSMVRK